jgi:hypothetical protein
MQAELDKSDLFELADTLGIELLRDKAKLTNQLQGGGSLRFRLMEGLNFTVSPEVVDSGVYSPNALAGVVVHLCGALYAVLLIDDSAQNQNYLSLWLVDGAKLNWRKKDFSHVFPVTWNRGLFNSRFRDGVIAAYQRKALGVTWLRVEDYKQKLEGQPIQDAPSFLPTRSVAKFSDKYRTKGPRDW